MTKKLALSILEICDEVGVSRSFVYKEIAAGRLKTRKAGKRTLILPDDRALGFPPCRSVNSVGWQHEHQPRSAH